MSDAKSPWYSTPASKRGRKPVTLTLHPETQADLEALSVEHGSKSRAVEALVARVLGKEPPL